MTSTNRVVANALAARNFSADYAMDAIYAAAKKMIGAGATHRTGYYWSVPKNLWKGADIVSKAAGGAVKVVRDDPDRSGFVIAEVTDPLAQALERKGVNSNPRPSFRMARNADAVSAAREYANKVDSLLGDADSLVVEANNYKAKIKKLSETSRRMEGDYRALEQQDTDALISGAASPQDKQVAKIIVDARRSLQRVREKLDYLQNPY